MGFKKKKCAIKEKINYLEENLAVITSQRHISAIESMGKSYKKFKGLTEAQLKYVDILVDNVRKVRNGNS